MHKIKSSLLIAASVLAISSPAWAAWNLLGTSDRPAWSAGTKDQFKDYKRIRINSIIVDDEGIVYASLQDGNNNLLSGLMILSADGTQKIDVDLSAKGYAGSITKFVKAGDGKIYALMNWLEVGWSYAKQVNRIIRIEPDFGAGDAAITNIWSPGAQSDANRIGGMTVDGDGNVVWTTNAADGYWKAHYLWRYVWSTNTVEDATPLGKNNGWSETHRLFDLEYSGRSGVFAVINTASTASEIGATPMMWGADREVPGFSYCPGNYSQRGNGNRWATATAYDAVNRKMWVGNRGYTLDSPWYYVSTPNASWTDNGEGGRALKLFKGSGKAGSGYGRNNIDPYPMDIPDVEHISKVTLAAKIRVNSCSGPSAWDRRYLLMAATDVGNDDYSEHKPRMAITLREDPQGSGSYRFKLWDWAKSGTPDHDRLVADIGPCVMGAWNEVYLYIDGSGRRMWGAGHDSHTVKVWLNDVKKYDAEYTAYGQWDNGRAEFGAGVPYDTTDDTNTADVDFDWVGCAPWEVAPDASAGTWPTGVVEFDPLNPNKDHGWWYLDFEGCTTWPDWLNMTNIMVRFNGAEGATGLFDDWFDGDGLTNPDGCVDSNTPINTNGNDPRVNQLANGGQYWTTALAINPKDGAAWTSVGGEATYCWSGTYGKLGQVYAIGANDTEPTGDQGMPTENESQVSAIAFAGDDQAVALVVDMTENAYKVYRNFGGSSCNTPKMDTNGDLHVDATDFDTFSACYNGPTNAPRGDCACLDSNGDSHVDATDFDVFSACYNGPTNAPRCAE